MKLGKLNPYQLLIGLFIGVVGSLGFTTLRNQTQPAPIIIEPAPTATAPQPTPTPAPMTVFVNGAVVNPGVYVVSADARVEELIEAAGGFTADAFVDGVNLAQPLSDGAQVFVATEGDSAEFQPPLFSSPAQGATSESEVSGQSGLTSSGLININTANREQLEAIPGVGTATAQKIVSYREDNGPFAAIEDIMNVSGIGEGKFADMQDSITVRE